MTVAFQASLWGSVGDPVVTPLRPVRTALTDGAWIDVQRGWLQGADVLFERLRDGVPWRAERRQMYERVVDVPRLLAFYDQSIPLPDPVLVALKAALDGH